MTTEERTSRLLAAAAAALERVQVGDCGEAEYILAQVVELDGTYRERGAPRLGWYAIAPVIVGNGTPEQVEGQVVAELTEAFGEACAYVSNPIPVSFEEASNPDFSVQVRYGERTLNERAEES